MKKIGILLTLLAILGSTANAGTTTCYTSCTAYGCTTSCYSY